MPTACTSRRRTLPALLLAAPLLAACATTSSSPPVDLAGHVYEFSGWLDGQQVKGTVRFPADGGYILAAPMMNCSRTTPRDVSEFRHTTGRGQIVLRCDQRRAVMLVVLDGEVADHGTIYAHGTRTSSRPGACRTEDERGTCISRETQERTTSVTHEGSLVVRRQRDS